MDYITLIRLNKPIYQPGDTVNFLVFALDYDTKPYKFNEISIDVLNSRNKKIRKISESPNDFKFNSSFKIPHESGSGEWKLQVRINKTPVITRKIFRVQKEVDNRVKIFIDVPSKVSFNQREVTVKVSAKHFTDMYASGEGKIEAEFSNPWVDDVLAESSKTFKLAGPSASVSFNFIKDFGMNFLSEDSFLNFKVSFTDDLSKNNYEESRKIELLPGGMYEIRHNNRRFLPGFDHKFTVNVFTLDGRLIKDQAMKVSMELTYSNNINNYLKDGILENGEVSFILQPAHDAREISIMLTVGDTSKRVTIEAVAEKNVFEANFVTEL